jgi:polyisoprenoid-binding protein YceI
MPNWKIDTNHSNLAFVVRHLFSRVRGEFGTWSGEIAMGDGADPLDGASFAGKIDVTSIDTRVVDRDNHLRSADFFDVATFPEATFASRRIVRKDARHFQVVGDLALHGVTREVALEVEHLGTTKDPWGVEKTAFYAETTLDRKEFGLRWNMAMEAGGVLVGEEVKLEIGVEATKV